MRTRIKSRAAADAEGASRPAAPVARIVASAPPKNDDEADRARGGTVQSIGRAFTILEEVARNRDGIGLADLSKRVGLHNSTTFHLVKTMVALGYIRQLKDSKRYRIGRPVFALAASALDEMEMVSMATPVLEDLSRQTGESSHFAVRMSEAVVVIARTSGPSAFQLTDRVGVVRPAYCTALGKVILGALRSDQLERYLQRVELNASTPHTITEPRALRTEIEAVRRDGFAIDDGEFDSEVRCIAFPVRDFTGQVTGAIGISGPVWRLSIADLKSRGRSVRRAAEQLSAAFGASAQK